MRKFLSVCATLAFLLLATCSTSRPVATPAASATPLPATSALPINTPLPMVGNPTGDLTLTIIYDNTAHDANLQTDWGFAALIQFGGHTVLFDTGANGQILVSNMDKLGIEPKKIEAIILSHAHNDHVNGLQALLDKGITPTVYVLPSFDSSFKSSVRARTNMVEVSGPLEILPGLHSTGGLGTSIAEQALVVETAQGIAVITGCAHPGILSIVRQAKQVTEGDVTLVVGGLHLQGNNPSQVRQIIADMRALGVRQISPTHCTGEAAIAAFADEYGEGYIQGGAGRVIKAVRKER